jgi:hypothetical protein
MKDVAVDRGLDWEYTERVLSSPDLDEWIAASRSALSAHRVAASKQGATRTAAARITISITGWPLVIGGAIHDHRGKRCATSLRSPSSRSAPAEQLQRRQIVAPRDRQVSVQEGRPDCS